MPAANAAEPKSDGKKSWEFSGADYFTLQVINAQEGLISRRGLSGVDAL